MLEPRLISPLLDNFIIGGPISDHHGVSCCPAMHKDTEEKYIVKIICVPSSQLQIDALLLTGAFGDEDAVLSYFKEIADSIAQEAAALSNLAELEGFLSYEGHQVVEMESGKGYEVYLLSPYKQTIEKRLQENDLTHLEALNFGLDLCSALSVCRRSGYLYVDLKPGNVFITDDRLYKIGDLGLVSLESLQFASMPEKYLSMYTPPEISDALSALNDTIDTYAVGMILYQIYNNGCLPFSGDIKPGCELPMPANADQELSEVILKACAVNPDDRWQDPMQLGQAIIRYMQLHGANDVPIAPEVVAVDTEVTEPVECQEIAADEEASAPEDTEGLDVLDYDTITDEVSQMLSQADDLVAHAIPELPVAPDYIEVTVSEDVPEKDAQLEQSDEVPQEFIEAPQQENMAKANLLKLNQRWIRYATIVLVILAFIAGGIFYHQNYYLLPIDGITVSGSDDTLTVRLSTDAKDSLLQVVCSDVYGNQLFAPVENRRAVFDGLLPNSAYSIKVVANGFHKLVGTTTATYSTPIQSKILQFDAVTGITDGSVILSFSVDGPDSKEWTVTYFAEGEEERTETFSSHIVTLTNLTVGKEYTFRLSPKHELAVVGETELKFTTSQLVKAENLHVVSAMNHALTVVWDAPVGANSSTWSVRCTGPNYSQTIVTTETSATFQDIDHTQGYVVEVKALGMSVSQGVSVPANTVTVTNFKGNQSAAGKLSFAWETSLPVPEDGWVLHYTIQGIGTDEKLTCSKNEAVIFPAVPNAVYHLWLEDTKGNVLLNSANTFSTGEAAPFYWEFSSFSISKEDLKFSMCRRPDTENWGKSDLSDSSYTTSFNAGEKAAFLVQNNKSEASIGDKLTVTFVVRAQNGEPLSKSERTIAWSEMWQDGYCPLEIPLMPTSAGKYTAEVYFNGGIVAEQQFTIVQQTVA